MNPTLSAALATLPSHIEWHPGDTPRQAFAHLATPNNFIAIDLQMSARPSYRLSVSLSRYERPTVRVSVDDRPDLLTAWTEVAEVVARVDAAAGAAMAGPPELADRITIARTKPPSAAVVAELEALLAEAQAAAPPPGADLTDRALWLAAYCAEEARDALAYQRGLLDCAGTPPA